MTQTSKGGAIRAAVRTRYAAAATAASSAGAESSCCGSPSSCRGSSGEASVMSSELYTIDEVGELPAAALLASLGCGNPTALAEL
jgi:arsenite methyltransferase